VVRLASASRLEQDRSALSVSADVIREMMARWDGLDEEKPSHRWRARQEIAFTIESLIAVLDRLTPDCDLEDDPDETNGDDADVAWAEAGLE